MQDTQQLKGIYEEAGMNSFLSNSYYRITFSANNIETAKLISDLIGTKTVKQYSQNVPKFLDFDPKARSKNESETQRALLMPQEVISLPRDEQIILVESNPPMKTKKIFYYQDSFFVKRVYDPKEPAKGGPAPCFVPIQEPYDPRKNKKAAAPKEPEKPKAPEKPAGKEVAQKPKTDSKPVVASANVDVSAT